MVPVEARPQRTPLHLRASACSRSADGDVVDVRGHQDHAAHGTAILVAHDARDIDNRSVRAAPPHLSESGCIKTPQQYESYAPSAARQAQSTRRQKSPRSSSFTIAPAKRSGFETQGGAREHPLDSAFRRSESPADRPGPPARLASTASEGRLRPVVLGGGPAGLSAAVTGADAVLTGPRFADWLEKEQ
jgi:hypothetical protein